MADLIPQHPGIELKKLISERGMNLSQFARSIDVSSSRISEIVSGRRSITIDSAVKFADTFSTTPEYWLTKQNEYDLYCRYGMVQEYKD